MLKGKLFRNYITDEIYTVIGDDDFILKLLSVNGDKLFYTYKNSPAPFIELTLKELKEFEHNLVMEELA